MLPALPSARSGASSRPIRRLVGAGLSVLVVAAACGSPAAPAQSRGPGASGSGAGSAGPLTAGLATGLATLTSYRFSESNVGAPGGAAASGSGAYAITGTVVNAPVMSIWIKEPAAQFMVIGSNAWTSVNGTSWSAADPGDLSLADLLPAGGYAAWFDAKAGYFFAVGDEVKNDIPCIHYQGSSVLTSTYVGVAGGTSSFRADVWIARDGNYPVSGIFGLSAASGSSTSWGFSFDITDVNSEANAVAAPTNVVAVPT